MKPRSGLLSLSVILLTSCLNSTDSQLRGPAPSDQQSVHDTYYVYVGAESADLIHRVKLDASGVSIDQTTPVGEMAVENEGPHGLNVSPDGEFLYMTTCLLYTSDAADE